MPGVLRGDQSDVQPSAVPMTDNELRSREEIEQRLRELHGTRLAREMGGRMPKAEANALLWVLGHPPAAGDGSSGLYSKSIDVSEYINVGNDDR